MYIFMLWLLIFLTNADNYAILTESNFTNFKQNDFLTAVVTHCRSTVIDGCLRAIDTFVGLNLKLLSFIRFIRFHPVSIYFLLDKDRIYNTAACSVAARIVFRIESGLFLNHDICDTPTEGKFVAT